MDVNYADWNPWHGCTKISPGCKYCYVYRQDEQRGNAQRSSLCTKTNNFDLPLKCKKDKSYKIEPGTVVFTCFSSDFLLSDADLWRNDCWSMIRKRSDCLFYFFTKRIERFMQCIPDDWDDGYDNVLVGCTVENQQMADYRLKIFNSLPIKHKSIIVAPMLENIELSKFLNSSIEVVSASGESGLDARILDFEWVLNIRNQCIEKEIPFHFHQTGAHLLKDGKLYNIPRKYQILQAHKSNIDFRILSNGLPETADYKRIINKPEYEQLTFI